MAAVCLDYQSSSFISIDQIDIIEVFPKIENHTGDIPYTPELSLLLLVRKHVAHPDVCIGLKAFSVVLVATFIAIVGLTGGKVMYYIPLYAAIAPVVYWLLKIAYAYYIVKTQKLHVESKQFSGQSHG